MGNTKYPLIINKNDKQIEDIIDARKQTGQSWSAPLSGINDEAAQVSGDDVTMWVSEGDIYSYSDPTILNIGPTDSEITVVRVKREGLRFKTTENKWNLNDEAIPGDGTHLGESPSLVNLVTLVGQRLQSFENKSDQYHEYLVPLSSWDPSDDPYNLSDIRSTISTNTVRRSSTSEELSRIKSKHSNLIPSAIVGKHRSFAGKLTNFLRKRCPKNPKVHESATKNGKSNEEMGHQAKDK